MKYEAVKLPHVRVVGGAGFEPAKSETADLQSAAFDRSATRPCVLWLPSRKWEFGAGNWTRTNNRLITNQLLYRLSYTSMQWCFGAESNRRHKDFQSSALPTELPKHCALWRSFFLKNGIHFLLNCGKKCSFFINGDAEGTWTLDIQRDRLAL